MHSYRHRGVHDLHVHLYKYITLVLMRDEEGRKNEASKVKQITQQSNIAHPSHRTRDVAGSNPAQGS